MSATHRAPYERPTLTRYGSFRELTRIGPDAGGDISSVFGISAGCDNTQSGDFGCGGGRS